MKLASWNVNSIRQRLTHVVDWLNLHEPDVLALQELKTEAQKFPLAELEATGYRCVLDGQKAYNGVALLSRAEPVDVTTGIPEFSDEQRDSGRLVQRSIIGNDTGGPEQFGYDAFVDIAILAQV